jgi:hypothetical protein
MIGGTFVNSKDSITVLSVIFDIKMSWSKHIWSAATKANCALNAIRLIRKYFKTKKLVQLIANNYYSILF